MNHQLLLLGKQVDGSPVTMYLFCLIEEAKKEFYTFYKNGTIESIHTSD